MGSELTVRHGEGSPLATVRHDLELKPFFRDILDHLQVQQNIDVRKISAWVALAAGPTMIAGIYGMNFRHLPELGTKYGYPIVIAVMVSLTAFLVKKFRKSGWL